MTEILSISCPGCKKPHEWDTANSDQRCYQCKYVARVPPEQIKFPLGTRVTHVYGGPATVIGQAYRAPHGEVVLPVRFDDRRRDNGDDGYYERFFTLIEPLDGEIKDGSIYSAAHGRWYQLTPRKAVAGDIYPSGYIGRVAVRTPSQYGPRNDSFWRERYESESRACLEYYEAHKDEVRKNIELRRELEAAREEIKRRVANIDKLQGTLDGIRRIMA